jgi:hypothetical protein
MSPSTFSRVCECCAAGLKAEEDSRQQTVLDDSTVSTAEEQPGCIDSNLNHGWLDLTSGNRNSRRMCTPVIDAFPFVASAFVFFDPVLKIRWRIFS